MNELEQKIYDQIRDKIINRRLTGGEEHIQPLIDICHKLGEKYKISTLPKEYSHTKELNYILKNFDTAYAIYKSTHL